MNTKGDRMLNQKKTQEGNLLMQNPEKIREDLKNSQDDHLVTLESQITDDQIMALIKVFQSA